MEFEIQNKGRDLKRFENSVVLRLKDIYVPKKMTNIENKPEWFTNGQVDRFFFRRFTQVFTVQIVFNLFFSVISANNLFCITIVTLSLKIMHSEL